MICGSELGDPCGDIFHRRAAHLPVTLDAVIADDFNQQQRHITARFVRGMVFAL